ncbi:MAG: hypothetical protein GY718_06285 [Lentisphaerae bacterium]|nr:hypothetical protein [Lentisphaerota bacterium]
MAEKKKPQTRTDRLMETFDKVVLQGKKEKGFYPSIFAQASLPYKEPRDKKYWVNTNGDVNLVLQQGFDTKDKETPQEVGLPYGALPRLIILYLASEAVKTKKREIKLGENISDFLHQLGKGSDSRARKRLIDQARRLFSSTFQFTGKKNGVLYGKHMPLVSDYQLWIGSGTPQNAADLFAANVKLSEEFFKEFTNGGAFPINIEQLKGISKSPLALDLYMWLVRRLYNLTKPLVLEWEHLEAQFGSQYTEKRKFRENFRHEINSIKAVWPELKIEINHSGMALKPSELPISKIQE